jgi:hypothetical protein
MVQRVFVALCGVLILAGVAQAQKDRRIPKPTGTEFKDGWSTYATAKEGDWVEYQISDEIYKRVEVKKVAGDKVTLAETLVTGGKAADPKERAAANWWEIRLPSGSLPKEMNIQWTTQKIDLGGEKVDVDVASWLNGTMQNDLFLCKSVPCGGYVKQIINGTASVYLRNFGDKNNKEGKMKGTANPGAKKPTVPEFYKQMGNVAVYKISDAAGAKFVRREVGEFDGQKAKVKETACDKDGKPLADAKAAETSFGGEDWGRNHDKSNITRKGDTLKAAGLEFKCDVYEYDDGASRFKEWLSDTGITIKTEVLEKDVLTTWELVVLKMQ